jgi:O-antigen/teichoic acid export membrane protein
VYGVADMLPYFVNVLLTPLYSSILSTRDYGYIALLLLFSTLAKILFRLGLDAGFFRVHYLLDTDEERQRLAGTVALFSAAVGTALFLLVVFFREPLTLALLGSDAPRRSWVVLVAADIFAGTFAFVPLNLLRIQDRPVLFSAFSVGRHTLNTVLKVVFVLQGFGVTGVLWSDFLATAAFSLALLPRLFQGARPALSRPLLRDVLAFGLPKVPHGLMVQVMNLADRKILDVFTTLSEVGVYQMGATVGSGAKFATAAFEPAWGPFVYSQVREPDAPRTLARVITYAFACFVAAGLAVSVLGREILILLTPKNSDFWPGAPVVPVIALGYVLHGVFLLTSIGIGIERKARYYPIVTAVSAAVNIGLSFALIPTWGKMGAAWATAASYLAMAGLGYWLSQRLYPLPLEWGRLLKLGGAAGLLYLVSCGAPATLWVAIAVKSALLLLFPGLLYLFGLLGAEERAFLRSLLSRGAPPDPPPPQV